MKFEIEKWDSSANSYIWIQVPALRGPQSYIWAYWGNPAEKSLPAYTQNGSTWSDSYVGVWHMGQNDVKDSLGSNDGKSNGNIMSEGVIGDCQKFPADSKSQIQFEKITEPLNIQKDITISAWVKPLSPKIMTGIITKGDGWGDYNLHLKAGSLRPSFELKPFLPDAANAPVGKTSLETGKWYYVCGSWDGVTAKLYVNGVLEAESKGKGLIDSKSHTMRFGTIENRFSSSEIDECRISNVSHSASWVWACYENQADNKNFCDYKVDK